jgi:hypothetical protein
MAARQIWIYFQIADQQGWWTSCWVCQDCYCGIAAADLYNASYKISLIKPSSIIPLNVIKQ